VVRRLSTGGRILAAHADLVLAGPEHVLESASKAAAAAAGIAHAQAEPWHRSASTASADMAAMPAPADTFEGLEQLAALLKQRASLPRHSQLIASLAMQRVTTAPAQVPPPELPPRVASAGPAAGSARSLVKQRSAYAAAATGWTGSGRGVGRRKAK
jgi:hypothetical protein